MERVKVVITNDQKKVKVPTGIRLLIRRCCHAVLELENFEGSAEVSVRFVDNEEIRIQKYRQGNGCAFFPARRKRCLRC